MRIGYITCVIYNTPDNLKIALEDNLIENLAKNSENHQLRINTDTFVQIAQQCNAASYDVYLVHLWTGFLGSSSSQLPQCQMSSYSNPFLVGTSCYNTFAAFGFYSN